MTAVAPHVSVKAPAAGVDRLAEGHREIGVDGDVRRPGGRRRRGDRRRGVTDGHVGHTGGTGAACGPELPAGRGIRRDLDDDGDGRRAGEAFNRHTERLIDDPEVGEVDRQPRVAGNRIGVGDRAPPVCGVTRDSASWPASADVFRTSRNIAA